MVSLEGDNGKSSTEEIELHDIGDHGENTGQHIEDKQSDSDNIHHILSKPSTARRPITIDNPFLTFDDTIVHPRTGKTELEEYVWDFACRSGLDDKVQLLIFGARLARDKHEAITRYGGEISARDRSLIDNEKKTGFWQQSKTFRATIMIASLAGSIQGWTQSINNAVNSDMPVDLGLCIGTIKSHCSPSTKDLWTFGMLNSIPLLSAGLCGVMVADPLQERYLGRRGSVMLSTIITMTSTIAASMTHTVAQLAACRAINGIALGIKASIIPIYSAEISPEHIRGVILANWQLADSAGMCLGFVAYLIIVTFVNANDHNRIWRVLTNTVLIPTIPLFLMIYLVPESPRYLMKHGKYRKALASFTALQTNPLLASRDFMYAHAQLDFESQLMRSNANEHEHLGERIKRSSKDVAALQSGYATTQEESVHERVPQRRAEQLGIAERGGSSHSSSEGMAVSEGRNPPREEQNPYSYNIGVAGYYKRLGQLWTQKRCRRALLSAAVAMISQQMTGVNTIALLGTTVWETTLGTSINPKVIVMIGLVFGGTGCLVGLLAYWLSDKCGRSILLAAGLPNMSWSLFILAFLFKLPDNSASRTPLISTFTIIFQIFYAATAGTSPFSISAEVFPLVSREAGMAVSVAINLLGAGVLVLLFPMLLNTIGVTASLAIFAALNLVAFVLVWLLCPETKRRTLEELQYTFDLSTRWHVRYRAVYVRRHFCRNAWRLLRRESILPSTPFYMWARIKYGGRFGEQ